MTHSPLVPLPALADILDTVRVVALPLTTTFRGIDVREAAIFEGPEGWTEFSPFIEYDDDEAASWLAAAIDFGWQATPTALRDEIPVNATIPAVDAASVAGILARFDGCRTAKVKVAESGQRLSDDIARVAAVRAALGPEGRIRVDANGGWNVDEAEHAVHAFAEFDLEYVEQPCATVEELIDLRRRVKYMGIPIAADESVRKATDPLEVARAGAADLLVIKAQPLGGVHRALDDRRRSGPSGRRLERPRHLHRAIDGGRSRSDPARTRLRLRIGHCGAPRSRRHPNTAAPSERQDSRRPHRAR